jgi:hypothetical protein
MMMSDVDLGSSHLKQVGDHGSLPSGHIVFHNPLSSGHLSPLGVSRGAILGLLQSAGVPEDMWLLFASSAVVGASGAAADLDGFTSTPPYYLLLDSIMM